MSKEKTEPVFAINGWEIVPLAEHKAVVFKLAYTKPPHTPASIKQMTPAFSLPAEQITQLILALQQSLAVLQSGEENPALPTQKGLH
ncbi:Uncharacterised protein [Serratia fonticola]|uniref:BssS family protein n=1 Tax=Serratia fonticola TaxID=47917 RepID=A0A448SP53_SERFO|nr:hypothetical protein [Serratia fonticola]CAI1821402.1 Uncharacterised protein [Serratia fonticola]VEI69469.1 Uncharacterised protein [Serratia fonticola]